PGEGNTSPTGPYSRNRSVFRHFGTRLHRRPRFAGAAIVVEHRPLVPEWCITTAVGLAGTVQAECRPGDRRRRNHKDLVGRAPVFGDADEDVTVPAVPPSMAVEVEVPASIVVRVLAAVDGHGMGVPPRERDAQRNANVAIDKHVELPVARHFADIQAQSTQAPGNGGPLHLMFVLTIHVSQPLISKSPNQSLGLLPPFHAFLPPRRWDQRL